MISSSEKEIRGEWKQVGRELVASPECERIKTLTTSYLKKIASDASGWDKLYQDPADKRYWELTYPQSGMHGGGPPLLRVLSQAEAAAKYKIKVEAL